MREGLQASVVLLTHERICGHWIGPRRLLLLALLKALKRVLVTRGRGGQAPSLPTRLFATRTRLKFLAVLYARLCCVYGRFTLGSRAFSALASAHD